MLQRVVVLSFWFLAASWRLVELESGAAANASLVSSEEKKLKLPCDKLSHIIVCKGSHKPHLLSSSKHDQHWLVTAAKSKHFKEVLRLFIVPGQDRYATVADKHPDVNRTVPPGLNTVLHEGWRDCKMLQELHKDDDVKVRKDTWKRIGSKNVVKCLEMNLDPPKAADTTVDMSIPLYSLVEYAGKHNFKEFVDKVSKHHRATLIIRELLKQVLHGLSFLSYTESYTQPVAIHHNLKPSKIIVESDDDYLSMTVRITGFDDSIYATKEDTCNITRVDASFAPYEWMVKTSCTDPKPQKLLVGSIGITWRVKARCRNTLDLEVLKMFKVWKEDHARLFLPQGRVQVRHRYSHFRGKTRVQGPQQISRGVSRQGGQQECDEVHGHQL